MSEPASKDPALVGPPPEADALVAADRVAGIDAYRGTVMFLMLAEVLHLRRVSEALPESRFWQLLAYHQTHVAWTGCSLHDLIQPSFSFLVGVALPFSIASRRRRGQRPAAMLAHAVWRALLLVGLGVFLRSMHRTQTNFTFEDTLSQIGLGYVPLFLLGFVSVRWQWTWLTLILIGYWLAFVLYPVPGPNFDYQAVGVPADWAHHATGIAAHFNLNSNFAWAFDTWFLNLFPREAAFTHNGGGYSTLSFIPTLATMILGLIAGGWLRSDATGRQTLQKMLAAGGACFAVSIVAERLGLCPIVKRIWTPTWTLFSGGWCFLILAGYYGVCDLLQARRWAFPFIVIGANSITAYVLAHCAEDFVLQNLRIHLGQEWSHGWGDPYAPLLEGFAVLACFFLCLWWMYRRRIFVRI